MSFLQKARDKAAEVAKEAADTTTRIAGAAAARASDPTTQERVKRRLATAGKTTGEAAREAADATTKVAGAMAAKAQDPATQARVKGRLASAGRSARTMVERIDPGILAEVVIKATALQEKANARLRRKGSIYRIGELSVTASLPPSVTFTILRIDDSEEDPGHPALTSTEILAAERAGDGAASDQIVSLDSEEQAAIDGGLSEAAASLDAAVDVLEVAGGADGPLAGHPET